MPGEERYKLAPFATCTLRQLATLIRVDCWLALPHFNPFVSPAFNLPPLHCTTNMPSTNFNSASNKRHGFTYQATVLQLPVESI